MNSVTRLIWEVTERIKYKYWTSLKVDFICLFGQYSNPFVEF